MIFFVHGRAGCDVSRRCLLRLGSQGKARSDKVKHGRVRFGSQGTSRQRLARCVSVWQSWCVQLSIVGFSNGLAVVAS